MARRTFNSIESTADQAEAMVQQGRWGEAERHYRDLIGQTHVINYEYDDWLRRLGEIYRHLGRAREAAFVYLYLHYFDQARAQLTGDEHTGLRARLAELDKKQSEAAVLYQRAKLPVHAAVAFEKAKQYNDAVAAWKALVHAPGLGQRPYEAALVHFNYGLAAVRLDAGSGEARRALIESQRKLEQVADDFEQVGELERAFDCFQILLKLGKESAQFENLAEGYVNCIRVLREDNLKFYVLQYYEDFIKLALERGELHAAATLYQEAAAFAARAGLPYDRHYQHKSALTWMRCADKFTETGVPVQMTENALLAAASQHSAVGDYPAVRECFEKLAGLELPDRAKKRFTAIAQRYKGLPAPPVELPGLPDYLKQQHAYADIWFVDLLEWEMDGDPFAVAASIVGDLRYPNGIRRRALVVLLTLADAQARRAEGEAETLVHVAELLGELQSYAALSPLEKLFQSPDAVIRRAAVRALRFLYFKRSFVIVRKALSDPDNQVREAALVAIGGLHFPHAFNPLARIYRESNDPNVRSHALQSIGKIQTVEAGEFLVMVLRQESGNLREAARIALAQMDNADVLPILRQHHEIETNPQVRDTLGELLRRQ
ncbi:MAG: HEAT repeat domain-containing protein [Myxococcota bacterium]|nr:HEAT repeat domain-containing protein [Deltaproteobacteria bacterium]MDQ3336408.1 HEAT repeat domain-containing protein [Myxococcota bacterium]